MLGRFADHFSASPVSFDVVLPDKTVQHFGPDSPSFRVTIRNHKGLCAIRSIDEGQIGDAYLESDIDIDGDMLRPFELRGHEGLSPPRCRLAVHTAFVVWSGPHQQTCHRRSLRHRPDILPQFP